MSITLQGSAAFDPEFVGQLSHVTRALLDAGFDPTAFVILKDRAGANDVPAIDAFDYDYTVCFGGERFTVTEPNDQRFLDHLLARIRDHAHDNADVAPPPGLIARMARWMGQPV